MMTTKLAWEAEHQRREWGRWPSEAVVRFVMRTYGHWHPRNKINFLDLGCGAGAISRFLADEGFTVVAIDNSATAIERCRKIEFPHHATKPLFIQEDVRTLGCISTGTCDCVIDAACLQCLDDIDLKDALSEIARVLKTGGRLFSRHASAHGWPGIHTVGDVYPRRVSDLNNIYGKHFICDFMHDCYERSHPTDAIRKVMIAHWNIEGTKR